MKVIAGIDIGGTKCAVSFAHVRQDEIVFLDKVKTDTDCFERAMRGFLHTIRRGLEGHPEWQLSGIGISCGGPLDAEKGLILSPPNLPGWDRVDVFTPLRQAFGVPVMLKNDADACALAEWRMGAGRGCRNMIFLTFGTGMGAGLILNNRLYSGATGMAGEVGHIRLEPDGPFGYGKCGSFEGFCSGGGIASLGRMRAEEALKKGSSPLFCRDASMLGSITGKTIADALEQGDPLAAEIYDTAGEYLGRGLAVLIDILNPERIIIGSIFGRQRSVLEKRMYEALRREALESSLRACQILPAGLGERIGDYAAVCVGLEASEGFRETGQRLDS